MRELADTDGRPVVNIIGTLVALGPLRRDLLPDYQRWVNDFATVRTLGLPPRPLTMEEEQAWYDGAATSGTDSTFTIYELSTWRPIGTTALGSIDQRTRTADFGILIGEPESRGKGYGTETTRLMLDYAFTVLGLHNVMLTVAEFNHAGLRAYARAGFREYGRRHACWPAGGHLYDTVYMECLATEFTSPVLARVFAPDELRPGGSS